MRTTKWVDKKVEVTDEVLCNMCGETCLMSDGKPYGLTGDVYGGYESTHLEDLKAYHFDICEKCLVSLFGLFKIPPDIEGGYADD